MTGPNMGTWCRAHELATATISNIAPVRTKTEKTTLVHLAFAAMLAFEWCYIIAFAACEAVW